MLRSASRSEPPSSGASSIAPSPSRSASTPRPRKTCSASASGAQAYAIRLSEIAGLHADKKITRVPGSHAALRGIAGFRGAMLPVYDLHVLLGHLQRRDAALAGDRASRAGRARLRGVRGPLARVAGRDRCPSRRARTCRGYARELVRTQNFIGPILHLPSVLDAIKALRTRSRAQQRSDDHMSVFSNWTVGKRLVAGFGLSALTLVVIAAVSYYNINRLIENDTWVKHTYQVRGALGDLVEELINGETGVRGFVITGDESFLEPYKSALTAIRPLVDELRKLTADNPNQQRRLALLSPLVDKKLAQFKERIDVRRRQGLDAAAKLVATGESKQTMDQIRALLRDADQEEANLLKRRSEEAKASRRHYDNDHPLGRPARHPRGRSRSAGSSPARSPSRSAPPSARCRARRPSCRRPPTSRRPAPRSRRPPMTEITTTISELLATSRQIAESAQRVAQIAEQTANAARSGDGTVDMTHEFDRRHPPPGRSDRHPHARARQEVAADRRRARHRLRARRADQHPRHQRHHRGGGRRRGRQALRRGRRRDPQARRSRRRLDQGDPHADRRRAQRGQHHRDGDRDRLEGGRRRVAPVRRRGLRVQADRQPGRRRPPRRRARSSCPPSSSRPRSSRSTSPSPTSRRRRGRPRRAPARRCRPRRSWPSLSKDLLRIIQPRMAA